MLTEAELRLLEAARELDPYELEENNVVRAGIAFDERHPKFLAALREVFSERMRQNFPDWRARFIDLYVKRDHIENEFNRLSHAIRSALTREQWSALTAEARKVRDAGKFPGAKA